MKGYRLPYTTPFCDFVLTLKLLSSDQSQILRDTSNELLNTHKVPLDSQCNVGNPGSYGECYAHYIFTYL